MKKLFLLIIPFLFISTVNADTILLTSELSSSDYIINQNDYDSLINYYNTNLSNSNPYYVTIYNVSDNTISLLSLNSLSDITQFNFSYTWGYEILPMYSLSIENSSVTSNFINKSYGVNLFNVDYNNNGYTSTKFFFELIDSNFDFEPINFGNFAFDEIEVSNFYSDTINLTNDMIPPKLINLLSYSSWSDFVSDQDYTTVNLNNYEYVILSLKNYNQTNPFQTNLQVKGQIGITPVYNFGQTSKDSITGVQVQDRCNLSYENFTSYPFYVIQSDLQNNAIYYIKACEENSSFKFNNTIFNIEYITQTNLNSPTVTINGQTYDTIPYSDLPSTATKNEENNYIPGQSGSATDVGGLDSAIKNAKDNLSSIWDTFNYFISFVGQLFNSLPPEISGVLIAGLVVSIILGLIKIFTG